jgi:hypothetical protein
VLTYIVLVKTLLADWQMQPLCYVFVWLAGRHLANINIKYYIKGGLSAEEWCIGVSSNIVFVKCLSANCFLTKIHAAIISCYCLVGRHLDNRNIKDYIKGDLSAEEWCIGVSSNIVFVKCLSANCVLTKIHAAIISCYCLVGRHLDNRNINDYIKGDLSAEEWCIGVSSNIVFIKCLSAYCFLTKIHAAIISCYCLAGRHLDNRNIKHNRKRYLSAKIVGHR